MDQVYAENGAKRSRAGRIVAWAIVFSLLQILSLGAVFLLTAWKMPYFNQELNTDGQRNLCVITSGAEAAVTGPSGEKIVVDGKESVSPRSDLVDKDGSPRRWCTKDEDCASGQICGTLSPSTALLKDTAYRMAEEKKGTKFAPGREPDSGLFSWGPKGMIVALAVPGGLMPPFVIFLLTLAIGIPLQRRAMRHVNALQLSDMERARLNGEIASMGAGADDPSRMGRFIGTVVGAVVLLLVAYPIFIVLGKAIGGDGAEAGKEAIKVPGMAWVVVFPVVASLIALVFAPAWMAGIPLMKKASFLLNPYKIGQGEQGPLVNEMARDGAQRKEVQGGASMTMLTAAGVGAIVAIPLFFIMVTVFGVFVMPFSEKVHPLLFVPITLIGMVFVIGLPFLAGYFVGAAIHKGGMNKAAAPHTIPITEKERQLYQAEFHKASVWIARAKSQNRMALMPSTAVAVVAAFIISPPLVLLSFYLPPPMIWTFLALPPFLPLALGCLIAVPMRRRVREQNAGFG